MLGEAVTSTPSLWAAMNSWFTPSVLFVLLNLVIGTIAITSSFANQKHRPKYHGDDLIHPHQPGLARSPTVLQRLRSINLYGYRSSEHHHHQQSPPPFAALFSPIEDSHTHYYSQQTHQAQTSETVTHHLFRAPSVIQRLKSINIYGFRSQTEDSDTHNYPQQSHQAQIPETETTNHISRAPSVLQRLSSINFFGFRSQEPQHCSPIEDSEAHYATHKPINPAQKQEDGEEDEEPMSLDEIYCQLKGRHVNRTKSDTEPSSGELLGRLPSKMLKSASMKSAFAHFDEEDVVEARRPATSRDRKAAKALADVDDEGVDAKADDFINRFKQHLKLQRLDSILRYKEMIGRGSEK